MLCVSAGAVSSLSLMSALEDVHNGEQFLMSQRLHLLSQRTGMHHNQSMLSATVLLSHTLPPQLVPITLAGCRQLHLTTSVVDPQLLCSSVSRCIPIATHQALADHLLLLLPAPCCPHSQVRVRADQRCPVSWCAGHPVPCHQLPHCARHASADG